MLRSVHVASRPLFLRPQRRGISSWTLTLSSAKPQRSKGRPIGSVMASSTAASASAETAKEVGAYPQLLAVMHWLVAPALLGTVATVLMAQSAPKEKKGALMHTHKSLGLLTGLLVAPRIAVKLMTRSPGALPGSSQLEALAARVVHGGLYGFMAVMPLTGIAMGWYGGKGLPFFWTTIKGAEVKNGDIAKQAFSVHKTVGTYGKYLVPLHVGAAATHAIRGHGILARINPVRPGLA